MDSSVFFAIFVALTVVVLGALFFVLPKLTKVDKSDLYSSTESSSIVKILEEFYQLRNNQAKLAFNFSIIAASLGFILLIFSIVYFLFKDLSSFEESVVSLISGVIIEAVAALFFRTHMRADKELQKNIDGLRIHALLEEFKNEQKKDDSRAKVIESLCEKALLAPKKVKKPNTT